MLGRLIDVISQSGPQDQDKECHEPTVGRMQQHETPAALRHWPDPFPPQHMCALAAGAVSARRKIGDTDELMQRVCTASMQRIVSDAPGAGVFRRCCFNTGLEAIGLQASSAALLLSSVASASSFSGRWTFTRPFACSSGEQ